MIRHTMLACGQDPASGSDRTGASSNLFAVFTDPAGLPVLLRAMRPDDLAVLVVAGQRPEQHPEMASAAARLGVELLVQPRYESAEYGHFAAQLADLAPALILVSSYSMLLRPDVLDMPEIAVNIHAALLPKYRGPNPLQWAMINDERQAGVSMHLMTADFDEGEILAQRNTVIRPEDSWVEVRSRLDMLTAQILSEQLPDLRAGRVSAVPQDESQASRYPRRKPADGVFVWDRPLIEIFNLVRALVEPLPGARSSEGEHFSTWTSMPRLAARKHFHRPDLRPSADGLPMTAMTPPQGLVPAVENSLVRFSISGRSEPAELWLDWDSRSGHVAKDERPGTRDAFATFLRNELSWPLISP